MKACDSCICRVQGLHAFFIPINLVGILRPWAERRVENETLRFDPVPRMSPTVGLLHAAVTSNYERLKRLVAGLNQTAIDYRGPQHQMNSIAQLLRHLAVVDLHWVYRLQSMGVLQSLPIASGR